MTTRLDPRSSLPLSAEQLHIAERVLAPGGRYSIELGIDVDAGGPEVERWFVAATLFGARIAANVAERTFLVLDSAGLHRIGQARRFSWDDLVALLDRGGYTRYDLRTATRLRELADALNERYGGEVGAFGRRFRTYPELRDALDALPGWGPVTVELFLRELRGSWPGAEAPLAARARDAGQHLGLLEHNHEDTLEQLRHIAKALQGDVRDLEAALVRLSLAHHGGWDNCVGGRSCAGLACQPSA
jgi:hypothetical protein